MSRVLLSLAMIVKNETENLSRCLLSASTVVDEMIVVDTGSTDATPALAEAHGARVSYVEWENDFSKARNAAIDCAEGAWVLVLDADEELSPQFRTRVRGLLERTDADAVRVLVENLGGANEIAASSLSPSVRLFRNDRRFRYERSIHEQITPSILRSGGTIQDALAGDIELRLLHHGYKTDRAQGGSRAARNAALLAEELRRKPDDPGLLVHAALAAKARSDLAMAREHLDRALASARRRILPDEALGQALTARAQIALADGDLDTAVMRGREACDLDRDNVAAAHVTAVALCMRGDLRAARPYLERVSASPRTHPSLRADVALLLAHVRRAA